MPPAKAKTLGEQPLPEGEIRRAAERAGIDPLPPPPDAEQARRRELSDKCQREADERQRRRYVAALSSIVSGGLGIDDGVAAMRPEVALLHVLGAQLKAVMLSLTSRATSTDTGPGGWLVSDEEMSDSDVLAALSGIVTMAQQSRWVIDALRDEGALVDENTRLAWDREKQAGGGAS